MEYIVKKEVLIFHFSTRPLWGPAYFGKKYSCINIGIRQISKVPPPLFSALRIPLNNHVLLLFLTFKKDYLFFLVDIFYQPYNSIRQSLKTKTPQTILAPPDYQFSITTSARNQFWRERPGQWLQACEKVLHWICWPQVLPDIRNLYPVNEYNTVHRVIFFKSPIAVFGPIPATPG